MIQALKHILCVDDEIDILEIAKMSLESVGGYQVSTCRSGKEACDRASKINPDMIILDVMMPGLDGPTVYSKLKTMTNLKDVPVVFMTAKVQPKEVASYIGLGATGVILKPFDPMQLPKEIENLWRSFHEH